jgi:hypothetical protein
MKGPGATSVPGPFFSGGKSTIDNLKITNPQSSIANRQSPIANRQSPIANG